MTLFTLILLFAPILHLTLSQVIPAPPIPPGQVLQIDGITSQGKVIYSLIPLATYQQQWIQQGQRQLYSNFPLGQIQTTGIITLANGFNLPQGGFLMADGLDAAGNVIYRVINLSVSQAQQALCPDRRQFIACGCQRPRPSFGPKLIFIPPISNGGEYILLMVQASPGNSRPNPACQVPPPIGPPISPCSILIPTPCRPIVVPGQPSISIQPGTVITPGQPGIIIVPINGQIFTQNSPYLPIQPGGIIIPNQPCTVQIPGAPGYPIQPGTIILGAQSGQNWNNLNGGRLVIQGEGGKPAVFVYPGQNFNPNLGDNGILSLQSGNQHPHPLIYPSFVNNFDQSADLLNQYISPPNLPNQPILYGGMSAIPSGNSLANLAPNYINPWENNCNIPSSITIIDCGPQYSVPVVTVTPFATSTVMSTSTLSPFTTMSASSSTSTTSITTFTTITFPPTTTTMTTTTTFTTTDAPVSPISTVVPITGVQNLNLKAAKGNKDGHKYLEEILNRKTTSGSPARSKKTTIKAAKNKREWAKTTKLLTKMTETGDTYKKTTKIQYKTTTEQEKPSTTPHKLKSTSKKVDKKSMKAAGKGMLTTPLNLKGLSNLLKVKSSTTANPTWKGIKTTIRSVEKTKTKTITPKPSTKAKVTKSSKFSHEIDFIPDVMELRKIIPDILSKPEGILTNNGPTLMSGEPLKPEQHLVPIFNNSESNLFVSLRVVNQTECRSYHNLTLKLFKYNFDVRYDDVLPLILPNPSFEKTKKLYPTLNEKPIGRIYPEGPVNEEDKPLEKGLHFLPDLHHDGVVLFRIVKPREWMDIIKRIEKSSTSTVTEVQVVTEVVTAPAKKKFENQIPSFEHELVFMN